MINHMRSGGGGYLEWLKLNGCRRETGDELSTTKMRDSNRLKFFWWGYYAAVV